MVGEMQIEINNLSVEGTRINADVEAIHVVGGGESHTYAFPLTITRDLQAAWGISDDQLEDGLRELVAEIYSPGIGLTWTAPQGGYWFDGHNSEATIEATVNKMRNEGRVAFLRSPAAEDRISGIFGGAIMPELEAVDDTFSQTVGMQLLRAPDQAFVRSRAVDDLRTPPENERDLSHKISLLATITDNFGVRLPTEASSSGSIRALTNWLADRLNDEPEARRMTEAFARVRDLRNQYPVHNQFERGPGGSPATRTTVEAAEQFFGFRDVDDVTAKWKRVCDAFRQAVQELGDSVAGGSHGS